MVRYVVAAIASSLVMFSLAGLFTGVLLRGFIANNVDSSMLRTPPNLPMVFLGYLFLAVLMSYAYVKTARPTSPPVVSGLRVGLMAAVAWLMPYSIVLFGVYKFPYLALPLDFGWALLEQGIGGAVIGLILGRRSGASAQPGAAGDAASSRPLR